MLRRWVLTRTALRSAQTGRADPDSGGFRVPDGFGGARRNYVAYRLGRPALTTGVLAGRQRGVAPVGALLTYPNAAAGTVVLTAWWAYSEYVQISRLHPDGTRVPVRGAAQLATGGRTRTNRAHNPRFARSLDGAEPGPNTSLQHLTSGPMPAGVTAAARLVATTDGRISVLLPLLASATGETLSLQLRASAFLPPRYPSPDTYPSTDTYPSAGAAGRIRVAWGDGAGVAVGETVHPIEPGLLLAGVGNWDARPAVRLTAPAGAQLGLATLEINAVPAGATVDVTAILLDPDGATTYFDGDTLGGNWAGPPHASTSTLAPTRMVVDGEVPIGADVTYEATTPALPGYRISTGTTRIDSTRTWLTDPADPAHPIPISFVDRDPLPERPLQVAEFTVPRRRHPVTLAEETRHVGGGPFTLRTFSAAEHARLLAALESPAPKLIRSPATHRHPLVWWWRIKDITETNPSHHARFALRDLAGTYITVDAPPLPRTV